MNNYTIQQLLAGQVKVIEESDLRGVEKLRTYAFASVKNLSAVHLPASIKVIYSGAFTNAPATLTTLTFNENTSKDIFISADMRSLSGYWETVEEGKFNLIANGSVMLPSKVITNASFQIPESVTNLCSRSLAAYGEETFTSFSIPDTVEIIQERLFEGHTNLSTLVIGSKVRYMGGALFTDDQSKTLIFKQPAGMYIDLPEAGDSAALDSLFTIREPGLVYNKTSRSYTIYTDNECILNYDWAADNVAATFYPLSEAPI